MQLRRVRESPPCKTWGPSTLTNELWAYTRLASDAAGVFKERAEKLLEESRKNQKHQKKGFGLEGNAS